MGGKIILNGKEYASSTPGGGASSFADLDDVDLTFLQDGEFPQYNSLTQKWENVTLTKVNDVKVNGTSVVNSSLVANIKSYKEVTQAEYELLPASKTSDGIAYFITDAVEAEGYPPLIYSLQEREVGVWIDGKPLYQKTYHFNASILTVTSGWEPLDTTINGEKLISLDITTYHTVYLESRAVKIRSDEVNVIPRFQISSGNFNYYTNSANFAYSGSDYEWDITIQYTKTTDTAGSGIWAGNGAMAHHYSTEEVIVGTWIDGKPLYEKTFANVAINTQLLTNIDTVILFRASTHGAGNNAIYHDTGDGFTKESSKIYVLDNGVVTYVSWSGIVAEMEKTADFIICQYTKTTD